MIRIRIGEEFKSFSKDGFLWYKEGRTYRVVIERWDTVNDPKHNESWIPIEVIDATQNHKEG